MSKVEEELTNIKKLKKQIQRSLARAPQGEEKIRCEMTRKKYPQYFLVNDQIDKYPRGKYLKKEEIKIAKAIVQKDYDKKMLSELNKQEKILENYLKNNGKERLQDIYHKFPEAKKLLISPYVSSDEEYLEQWYEEHKGEQNSYRIMNGFVTERRETVRSKTEKMIADKLFYKNIPYQYEAPLELKIMNKVIYPDFTILNLQERKTFYLEHFGMMDDPDYCKKAIEKINMYAVDGLFVGETLLFTMESSLKPIDMQAVDEMIEHFLI